MPSRKNNWWCTLLATLLLGSMVLGQGTLSRKQTNPPAPQQIQATDSIKLTLQEFLGYVKKHHPVVKQANLVLEQGQAELLRARGGFDPKLDVDYDRKDFKGTEYYDELYGTFKVPTWYGVEFKAAYERNEGSFLDPSLTVPDDGLYSAGVTVQLAEGLLINDRMATLRQAKLFRQQTQSERALLLNDILFEAAQTYFNWWRAAQEQQLYGDVLVNALQRYKGIRRSVELGYLARIDSIEARGALGLRKLGLQQANLDFAQARLELSNFIWINGIPVELREGTYPEDNIQEQIDASLEIMGQSLGLFNVENHPKILALEFKRQQLEVERRLKANKLLPTVQLSYDAISPTWNESYNLDNFKAGLTFSTPLFLRKERGDLQLARIKLQDADFDILQNELEIKNKVAANFIAINGYQDQTTTITQVVEDTDALLRAEERKFELGDSSLFLINSREAKLIDTSLKRLEVIQKLLEAKAKLFNSLAIVPENL